MITIKQLSRQLVSVFIVFAMAGVVNGIVYEDAFAKGGGGDKPPKDPKPPKDGGGASGGPLDIPDWTTISGLNPVTPTNILGLGGEFKYEVKGGTIKMEYKAKGQTVSLEDVTLNGGSLLGNSIPIDQGTVEISAKDGSLTVWGRNPLNASTTGGDKVVLVTADYIASEGVFGTLVIDATNDDTNNTGNPLPHGTWDLWGVNTSNIECLQPGWGFCTSIESLYIAGDFGSNLDKIKSKNATLVATIPVPAVLWLFGSGLIALVGVARRKKYS
jgi:hypothetical protein